MTCLQRRLRTLNGDLLFPGAWQEVSQSAPVTFCFPHTFFSQRGSMEEATAVGQRCRPSGCHPRRRTPHLPHSKVPLSCVDLIHAFSHFWGTHGVVNHSGKLKRACLHTCGPARCKQDPAHVVSWTHLLGYICGIVRRPSGRQ